MTKYEVLNFFFVFVKSISYLAHIALKLKVRSP